MENGRSGCAKLEVKADMIVGGQHCTPKYGKWERNPMLPFFDYIVPNSKKEGHYKESRFIGRRSNLFLVFQIASSAVKRKEQIGGLAMATFYI